MTMEKDNSSSSIVRQFTRDYLIVSIIPLILLLFLVLVGTKITRDYLADMIQNSTYDLNMDAEMSLQKLGEEIIRQKARDVARQVEIYLRMHPGKSIQEMRKDSQFMELALQKVGDTGYTAIYEAGTWIFRVHPNPKLIDKDVSFLAKELPSWWDLVGATHSGAEVSGYYDWRDIDGTIRKKYMTITPIKIKIHGTIMMFAATTYIDEFSVPIVNMRKKADNIVKQYQLFVNRLWLIFGVIAGVIVFLTFAGTYLLGRKAALRFIFPIMNLSNTANELGEGKWDAIENKEILDREDEIGTLAQALSKMSVQLKELFGHLEQRVEELHEAQEAAKKSEEHYRGLFDGVPVGLYRTSEDGKILDANPTLIQMLGYPDRDSFISRKADEYYVDPVDRDEWKEGMRKNDSIYSFETRMFKYDGTEIWVENFARVVKNEEGEVLYFEGSLKDISEKKAIEAQLQHVERMEAIGTLAGGIAHDFNNLLMAIQGNISLMKHAMGSQHPHYSNMTDIENQIHRGSRLTSQLLGYARKGKYKVEPLDLNKALIETAETFCRTRKDITLHQDLSPNLHSIEADVYQIEQMLMNIFINASDAMPDGGDLYLETKNVYSDGIKSKAYTPQTGNYVMLNIKDTGVGMDDKTMGRIFDPFFTTKDMGRGTGLGLASVYGIVKNHDGYIDVRSEKDHGSSFDIYFPASDKVPVDLPQETQKPSKGKGTILLIDDEEDVLNIEADVLGALGYTVLTAKGGREAVEIYKAKKDSIDLIILDMIMPVMSGSKTFDRLKEINPDVNVLLSSGYSIEGKATEIIERGCKGFIQKPYDIEMLSQKIKSILDGV